MSEILMDMGRFAFQAVVILTCGLVLLAFVASLVTKEREGQVLKVKNLNRRYKAYTQQMRRQLLDKKQFKQLLKLDKKTQKNQGDRPTLYVLDFDGDIRASAAEQLREEVSALLLMATPKDHVLLRLESPGGVVHGYGLATSQLQRIKDKGLPLTVAVDKVAASGGYMMAAVATTLRAAPFAIIGSIGVIASLPNFNKLLRKNDVDYLEITAGEFKRTLTPLGEITESGKNKFKEQIESVHSLFKNHVSEQRKGLEIDKVATGEYWYGQQAKELGLVDEIGTSDDFILGHLDSHTILSVKYEGQKTLKDKLAENLNSLIETGLIKIMSVNWRSPLT